MIKQKANQKHSYQVMKLDYMLDRYMDFGFVDVEELHDFVRMFRHLPQHKQRQYAWMLDEVVELWDAAEQPEY